MSKSDSTSIPLYPVLVVAHDIGRLEDQLTTMLKARGLDPEFREFSHLPSPKNLSSRFFAVICFRDLAVAMHMNRVKTATNHANVPYLVLQRKSSSWVETLDPHLPPAPETSRPDMLAYLTEKGDGRCWGWHLAVLQNHPALKGTYPANLSSREDLLAYIDRLGPESLPESLRPKRQITDAPVPPPAPPSSSSPPAAVQDPEPASNRMHQATLDAIRTAYDSLREEYDLLKPEYDEMAAKFEGLVNERDTAKNELSSAREAIADLNKQLALLSAEIGKKQDYVSPTALQTLSEKWKSEGRKAAEEKSSEMIRDLNSQVDLLRVELRNADEELVNQEQIRSSLNDRITHLSRELEALRSKKTAPKGLTPAAHQPLAPEILTSLERSVAEGFLSYEEGFKRLLLRVRKPLEGNSGGRRSF